MVVAARVCSIFRLVAIDLPLSDGVRAVWISGSCCGEHHHLVLALRGRVFQIPIFRPISTTLVGVLDSWLEFWRTGSALRSNLPPTKLRKPLEKFSNLHCSHESFMTAKNGY